MIEFIAGVIIGAGAVIVFPEIGTRLRGRRGVPSWNESGRGSLTTKSEKRKWR